MSTELQQNPEDSEIIAELCAKLGASVPTELLGLALTHPSAVGEGIERTLHSNQRLEFLGDVVLGLIVAEHLYRSDALLAEGELTDYLPVHAAKGYLNRRLGRKDAALASFRRALALAQQQPEQRYLTLTIEELESAR